MSMEPQVNFNAEAVNVGRLLRHTRTMHGQTIEGVAQLLRIRKVYLEAIENSQYDALPGGPYGLGFVKGYAEHLGLDGKEIVRRYKEESNAPAVRSELSFPKPVQESRVPGGAMMLIAAVLGIVAYGGWYYLSSQGKTIADLVEPLPDSMKGYTAIPDTGNNNSAAPAERERTLENAAEAHAAEVGPRMGGSPSAQASESMNDAIGSPVEGMFAEPDFDVMSSQAGNRDVPADAMPDQTASAGPNAATAPVSGNENANVAPMAAPASPSGTADANTNANANAVPQGSAALMPNQGNIPLPPRAPNAPQTAGTPEVASVPAAPEVGDAGGGRVFGAVNADSRVTISANETSWVRIREDDGNILLTRMLSAGDVYRVPNRDGLKLEVGNAGALSISVDATKNVSIGSYGQVISNYSLNPDDILASLTEKKTQ